MPDFKRNALRKLLFHPNNLLTKQKRLEIEGDPSKRDFIKEKRIAQHFV